MGSPDSSGNEGQGEWVWCLHCERCYRKGEYREVKTSKEIEGLFGIPVWKLCPYEKCDGDTVFDARPWAELAVYLGHPNPPKRGVVYPMTSEKK